MYLHLLATPGAYMRLTFQYDRMNRFFLVLPLRLKKVIPKKTQLKFLRKIFIPNKMYLHLLATPGVYMRLSISV